MESLVAISKFLSLVLRHRPEAIGLTLGEAGWVSVDDLLRQCALHGRSLDRSLLEQIVRTSDKQRFAFSQDGLHIRANQGHSVPVDLGLAPASPPGILYHGTAVRFWSSIAREGLKPRNRVHVHLSPDRVTALRVGERHGTPVILEVAAGRMEQDGYVFYRSENGVWLTGHVPPTYLTNDDLEGSQGEKTQ